MVTGRALLFIVLTHFISVIQCATIGLGNSASLSNNLGASYTWVPCSRYVAGCKRMCPTVSGGGCASMCKTKCETEDLGAIITNPVQKLPGAQEEQSPIDYAPNSFDTDDKYIELVVSENTLLLFITLISILVVVSTICTLYYWCKNRNDKRYSNHYFTDNEEV